MAKKNKVTKQREIIKDTKSSVNTSCNICLIITSVVVVLLGYGSFQIYNCLTSVPETPNLDLNEWWGHNTTKVQDTSIRPYRIIFSDSMQEAIRRLFDNYRRRPNVKSLTESWNYGVNSNTFAQFFAYWQFKYTFRDRVRYLNKYDHFKTRIQGLDVHFVHVKPAVETNVKVLPILLLHGWPGSFRDFFEVIPILTTQQPGYDFVFEVIVPSLPGFIYSQATPKRGMSPAHMGVVMKNLMAKLGHDRFFIQCGGIGHLVGSNIATLFPNNVIGLHTNFPVNFSKLAQMVGIFGSLWPKVYAGEHADRVQPLSGKLSFLLEESGYFHIQSSKPDTIGYVLQDSPVGLAAYMLDRYKVFTNSSYKETAEGGLDNITAIELIDNVMLYWITGSTTTALRAYKEILGNIEMEQTLSRIPTLVPTWGLRTGYELLHQPEWLLRWKYPSLLGITTLSHGGHFAALEVPKELAEDVYKAVKSFIEFQGKLKGK